MNNNIKYIVAIITLSILLTVVSILLFTLTSDLRDTANMYKNSKNTCRMELEELKSEYKLLEQLVK